MSTRLFIDPCAGLLCPPPNKHTLLFFFLIKKEKENGHLVCKVKDKLARPSYKGGGGGGRSREPGTEAPPAAQVGELSWTERGGANDLMSNSV